MKNLLKLSLIPLFITQAFALEMPFNGQISFDGQTGSFEINKLNFFGYSAKINNSFEFGVLPPQYHFETVEVLSSSILTIQDKSGHDLTANLGFTFLESRDSSIVDLISVQSHLENLSYSGTNQTLKLLAESKNATFNLNSLMFNNYPGQEIPPNLNELALGGKVYSSHFVGYIHTIPDAGATILLLGLGLGTLLIIRRVSH